VQPEIPDHQGRDTFAVMCAKCHDEDAEGDGPRHGEYRPPPANLTLIRDAGTMFASIVQRGISGTGMPMFPVDMPTIESVMSYIQSRPPDTTREWGAPWELENAEPDAVYGATLYVTACIDCHGEAGDGKGVWAQDPRIWPKPADLLSRNSQLGRVYSIITNGREGTMMAPQKGKFPARSRWALAGFVHSIFDPSSLAPIQTPDGMEEKKTENPLSPDDQGAVDMGEQNFELYCVNCHNAQGKGSFLAPRLTDRRWDYGKGTDTDLFVLIEKGIPGRIMPAHRQLEEETRWQVITYLRHRGGKPDRP